MTNTFRFFAIVLAVLGFTVGWMYGDGISFSKQWPLYEALRTTAAIIFAVVGAWFAIIYPEKMRGAFRGEKPVGSESDDGLDKLLYSPIVHSTVILCIILLAGIAVPILREIEFLFPYKEYFRRLSYGILVLLTLWQVWIVIMTLIPAQSLKSASDQQRLKQENINAYSSNKIFEDDET